MTTMVRPSVLLLCVLIGLFATVHPQRLKPLKDAFEITNEVVIPCGSRCVVESYREVLGSANKCVMSSAGIQMEVERYLRGNILNSNSTYQQIYDAMFSEGRSPLCRWYRKYGGCLETELGRICGGGVMQALTGLRENFEMLICSQNPNYIACVTHPSLIDEPSQPNTSPNGMCLVNIMAAFQNITYDNFYEELIIHDNGEKLFRTLRTYGNCVGNAVKTVTVSPPRGCTVVGEDIKKYINDALDYFHFGQGGKDYVKCFSNRTLQMDLRECIRSFASNLHGNPFDLNTTLFRGEYSTLYWPYSRLSTCFKGVLNRNCERETDSVAMIQRYLHPLDHLFGIRSDNATFCNGVKSSVASLALILCGLFMILCVLLRLN